VRDARHPSGFFFAQKEGKKDDRTVATVAQIFFFPLERGNEKKNTKAARRVARRSEERPRSVSPLVQRAFLISRRR
jgi:hypothetical protein